MKVGSHIADADVAKITYRLYIVLPRTHKNEYYKVDIYVDTK